MHKIRIVFKWLDIARSFMAAFLKNISICVLMAMMFLVAADVCLRYVFNRPIDGGYELMEYMMALIVSLGVAYNTVIGGNIHVDMVVSKFPQKVRAILGILTEIVSLGIFSLIAWQHLIYFREVYDSKLESCVLKIPAYPFVGVLAVCFLVICFSLSLDLLHKTKGY